MDKQKELIIEDSFLIAALEIFDLKKTLKIIPFKKTLSSRVAWKVQGNAMPILERIYRNENVPVNDFIRTLKSVRSAIFTLKSINNETSESTKCG